RRRSAVAAALAVAAVAVAISVIGYVSTRSHLVGDLKGQLHTLAAPFLQPHREPGSQGQRGPAASGQGPQGQRHGTGEFDNRNGFHVPSPPEFGAARGYFQVVYPD